MAAEGGARTGEVLGGSHLVGGIDGDGIDGDKAREVWKVILRDKCSKMETAQI